MCDFPLQKCNPSAEWLRNRSLGSLLALAPGGWGSPLGFSTLPGSAACPQAPRELCPGHPSLVLLLFSAANRGGVWVCGVKASRAC